MTEQLALLVILLFIIFALSKFITRMMKSGNEKFKIPILYGRVLLGFLLSMLIYLIFLMFKGENIITKLFGSQ
jgi:Na+-transporting methylmalonyl-CoA/oxaloacetate decarboxylase gamma subunit